MTHQWITVRLHCPLQCSVYCQTPSAAVHDHHPDGHFIRAAGTLLRWGLKATVPDIERNWTHTTRCHILSYHAGEHGSTSQLEDSVAERRSEIECVTVGNLCMVEQWWTVVSGAQDTSKSGSSLSFVQTVKCNTFVCGRILASTRSLLVAQFTVTDYNEVSTLHIFESQSSWCWEADDIVAVRC